ncbi:hypothetical protein BASA82_000749 [Batrachochytrium salamandrivorans]|nr:hypothetical protein BASA82_000749 [Batrachochytrium salamandrivorans]KAH9267151.1 hypothetical protein BASA84_000795 [Batrachochytrium salamandrivorans]
MSSQQSYRGSPSKHNSPDTRQDKQQLHDYRPCSSYGAPTYGTITTLADTTAALAVSAHIGTATTAVVAATGTILVTDTVTTRTTLHPPLQHPFDSIPELALADTFIDPPSTELATLPCSRPFVQASTQPLARVQTAPGHIQSNTLHPTRRTSIKLYKELQDVFMRPYTEYFSYLVMIGLTYAGQIPTTADPSHLPIPTALTPLPVSNLLIYEGCAPADPTVVTNQLAEAPVSDILLPEMWTLWVSAETIEAFRRTKTSVSWRMNNSTFTWRLVWLQQQLLAQNAVLNFAAYRISGFKGSCHGHVDLACTISVAGRRISGDGRGRKRAVLDATSDGASSVARMHTASVGRNSYDTAESNTVGHLPLRKPQPESGLSQRSPGLKPCLLPSARRHRHCRQNYKLPTELRVHFTDCFDVAIQVLADYSHRLTSLPLTPLEIQSIVQAVPRGCGWTIWLPVNVHRQLLSAKLRLAPGSTHGEFISLLIEARKSSQTSAST